MKCKREVVVAVIDTREYRRTIGLFATGVTIITVQTDARVYGMTANAVTSVSLDPLLLLVCVDRRARLAQHLGAAGRFAVNVLGEHQEAVSRHFSGAPNPALTLDFSTLDGVPVLADALATLACTVDRILDGGDHIIVLGRVDALDRPAPETPPLLYFGGEYRQIAPRHGAQRQLDEDEFAYQHIAWLS